MGEQNYSHSAPSDSICKNADEDSIGKNLTSLQLLALASKQLHRLQRQQNRRLQAKKLSNTTMVSTRSTHSRSSSLESFDSVTSKVTASKPHASLNSPDHESGKAKTNNEKLIAAPSTAGKTESPTANPSEMAKSDKTFAAIVKSSMEATKIKTPSQENQDRPTNDDLNLTGTNDNAG